jgi:sortase A
VPEQPNLGPDCAPVVQQINAQYLSCARPDLDEAREGAQQRGLSSAVRTSEQDDLTRLDVEVDTGEGGEPAEERNGIAEVDDMAHEAVQGYGARTQRAETGSPHRYRGPVLSRILSTVGKLFIAVGVLLLGFVAFQLWGTSFEHNRGQDELAAGLASEVGDAPAANESADLAQVTEALSQVDPVTAPPTPPPPNGDAAGIIEIPKIGVAEVFVQGVTKADLKKGPGHYPETPMPGQAGNAGIAGHRTTYGAPFNRLDELAPGDEIITYTPQGEFRYEVLPPPDGVGIERGSGWYTVRPDQVEVLDDFGDNRITLTACHPKRSARQRIIVHAQLVTDVAPAPPPEALPVDSEGEVAAPAELQDEEIPEELFAGDGDAKWPAVLLGAAAIGLFFLIGWFASRWKGWRRVAIWIAGTPALLLIVWFCFVYTDRFLPSF